jgi:hypothetical protein
MRLALVRDQPQRADPENCSGAAGHCDLLDCLRESWNRTSALQVSFINAPIAGRDFDSEALPYEPEYIDEVVRDVCGLLPRIL